MASCNSHYKWVFRSRFRRHAFGWRSQPAITRIKEAVSEIKKTARRDPVLGEDGAVLFLEKISPAIELVDSSSGAIGGAVNGAISVLVPIIAAAPAEETLRDQWLDRLWQAVETDNIPYIEFLTDYWGTLCVTPERASYWADEFIDSVRMAWSTGTGMDRYFKGTSACLSALLTAGRNTEILELLDRASYKFWQDRMWGVKALLAMGKKGKALRFAEDSRGLNTPDCMISEMCEHILLSSGMAEEAYNRYAIEANQKNTYQGTFRIIIKKYPHKKPEEILSDLVASTPGREGKWFAAAKSAGLYGEAIALANRTPCEPRTLIRAARDMAESEPLFAVEAGMAALRWLVEGYGYEITSLDVLDAYGYTMNAAENAECRYETVERIRGLVSGESGDDPFVTGILSGERGLRQE